MRFFLLVACIASAWIGVAEASCFVVNGNTIKSDSDGPGPNPYPSQSYCKQVLSCGEGESVFVTSIKGSNTGTSYFTLQLTMMLFGHKLINHKPWMNGAGLNVQDKEFFTREVLLEFKNNDAATGTSIGGFELVYQCIAACTSTGSKSFTLSRNGTFGDSWTTGSQPETCTYTLSALPCKQNEMVSYNFLRRPMYDKAGKDPDWKIIMEPVDTHTPMPAAIFPNDYLGQEMFLVNSERKLIVRSRSSNTVDWFVHYYCTPVSNCSANTEPTIIRDPYGAIISDYDGQYDLVPYSGPQTCSWDVRCPYDSNIFIPVLSGGLTPGSDSVSLVPSIGSVQSYDYQVINYPNMQRGTPYQRLVFDVKSSGGWKGFTFKYECHEQCALPNPQYVSMGPNGTLTGTFTALKTYSDMCRWETTPNCNGENNIELEILKDAKWETTWKLIIDRVSNEFEHVFPNTSVAQRFWISNAPFNLSVRAFGGTYVDYAVGYRCINKAVCNGKQTVGFPSGVLLSDADGAGPLPFTDTECELNIDCGKGFKTIEFTEVLGSLSTSYAVSIDGTSYSGNLNGRNIPMVAKPQATIKYERKESPAAKGGFTLYYKCIPGALAVPLFVQANFSVVCNATGLSAMRGKAGESMLDAVEQDATNGISSVCTIPQNVTINTTPYSMNGSDVIIEFKVFSDDAEKNEAIATCISNNMHQVAMKETAKVMLAENQERCAAAMVDRSPVLYASPCGAAGCSRLVIPDTPAPNDDSAPLAAPEEVDDDDDNGAIIAIIVAAIVAALIILVVVIVMIRRVRMGHSALDIPFFSSPGRYTKGFDIQGDAELAAMGADRGENDKIDALSMTEEISRNRAPDQHISFDEPNQPSPTGEADNGFSLDDILDDQPAAASPTKKEVVVIDDDI